MHDSKATVVVWSLEVNSCSFGLLVSNESALSLYHDLRLFNNLALSFHNVLDLLDMFALPFYHGLSIFQFRQGRKTVDCDVLVRLTSDGLSWLEEVLLVLYAQGLLSCAS